MMEGKLRKLAQELDQAREMTANAKQVVESLTQAILATEAGSALKVAMEVMAMAKESENVIHCLIEQEALQAFQDTGSKQLGSGIGIRVYRRAQYDEDTVRDWAIVHAQVFLQLNRKAFERAVPSLSLDESMVSFTETPTVTVASDLKKVL